MDVSVVCCTGSLSHSCVYRKMKEKLILSHIKVSREREKWRFSCFKITHNSTSKNLRNSSCFPSFRLIPNALHNFALPVDCVLEDFFSSFRQHHRNCLFDDVMTVLWCEEKSIFLRCAKTLSLNFSLLHLVKSFWNVVRRFHVDHTQIFNMCRSVELMPEREKLLLMFRIWLSRKFVETPKTFSLLARAVMPTKEILFRLPISTFALLDAAFFSEKFFSNFACELLPSPPLVSPRNIVSFRLFSPHTIHFSLHNSKINSIPHDWILSKCGEQEELKIVLP